MGGAVLAGGTADWQPAGGAGQEGRGERGQAGGADRAGVQGGPGQGSHLHQHGLPGPDIAGCEQAAAPPRHLRHSEWQAAGLGAVDSLVLLAAVGPHPAPGAEPHRWQRAQEAAGGGRGVVGSKRQAPACPPGQPRLALPASLLPLPARHRRARQPVGSLPRPGCRARPCLVPAADTSFNYVFLTVFRKLKLNFFDDFRFILSVLVISLHI